jgi:uncharacterized protein YlzI (FlbEa/FlbD family)
MLIELTKVIGGKISINHNAIEIVGVGPTTTIIDFRGNSGSAQVLESPAEVNALILAAIKAEHTARLEAEAEFESEHAVKANDELTVREIVEWLKIKMPRINSFDIVCDETWHMATWKDIFHTGDTIDQLTALVRARD